MANRKRTAALMLLGVALACVGGLALAAVIGGTGGGGDAAEANPAFTSAVPAPRRVKVLWLGDEGHHHPLDRCRQVFTQMARRGIDLSYTQALSDLNPQTLGRYDALLLYANIDAIQPAQEKALLDYVAGGGGFVPIHCGSYCFLNSPKAAALIGGRFKSHGTGVFAETIVRPDHPIEKGLKPIQSWDESYVHELHNPQGRTVLGERVDGQTREPYTWTRTEGKGRVFYTAWGHDARTWSNANFQLLLERGIRWAAGDWAMTPAQSLPTPQVKQEHPIPNYLPGEKWGTEGGAIFEMQKPLAPADSIRHMALPPGFEAMLFAAEPDIHKPICMAFDERGRLWLAETVDYPNDLQSPGQGHDQIKICQDTDGDGKADKFTVFADHLSIPTGLCFANGGVIVLAAPHTLFLKDTDGDDKADVKRVLFSGWGTSDTHAGPSSLRYGLDNWVWGVVGYSGFRGKVGGRELSFSQGIFRMKPDGSALEFLGNTNNNTWGLGFSEEGFAFASTANSNPSFFLSIPYRYYEQVKGMSVRPMEMIADVPNIYPIVAGVRQMDHHGEYTAGAGHALYTARAYPRDYWNRAAFIAEPTAHLLGRFVIEPKGSGFSARNDFNLLGSSDGWTSPVTGEVGPDGAVWFNDWYNYIIQHNPIPRGFEKGKGNAYVTPLRDKSHGRVYRLVYNGADAGTPSPALDLSKAGSQQLLDALQSDNQLWRMHAQRLLVERGDKSVVEDLVKLSADRSVDAIGLNAPAIQALWTLHGLGALDAAGLPAGEAAEAALGHPSAGVRQAALEILPRVEQSAAAVLRRKLLDDPDAHVRKAALLALAEMPFSAEVGAAVYGVATRKELEADRWMADAVAIAAARHDAGFLQAAFADHPRRAGDHAGAATRPASAANLVPNSSFEELTDGRPKGWKPRHYAGLASQETTDIGRTGDHSVLLRSERGADTSWFIDVPVTPNTAYTLSGWIKVQNVRPVGSGLGALLNIHNLQGVKTPALAGTSDWKRVSVAFNSGAERVISINCLLGGWGQARGMAWFDDIELIPGARSGIAGAEGRIIAAVVNQYARRAPVDSVAPMLQALTRVEPGLATETLAALAEGWPRDAAPKLTGADAEAIGHVMETLSDAGRDRLLALAGKWNRQDLFAAQLAAARESLMAAVSDAKDEAAARSAAARRLIAIDDGEAAIGSILKQINPASPPDLQTGLLGALADSHNPLVGDALVKQWTSLTPTAQQAATELLLRRVAWTEALLSGIKAGAVNPRDLQPQHWQALDAYPDPKIKSLAATLQKSAGRSISPDRKAVVDKFMPLADKAGDAAAGKFVFEKNCIVCHTIDGQGGKVGPLLTGMGARSRADNLIDILDPNRSVEGTYRQWIARTEDDVISGRMAAESRTSVEIIDAAGQTHTLQRDQIKKLTASDQSVMPEGFEALPPQDLVNLLEYISASKVKP